MRNCIFFEIAIQQSHNLLEFEVEDDSKFTYLKIALWEQQELSKIQDQASLYPY